MFVQSFGEGKGGGGWLTSRVMVYVKMVNENARETTSSSEPLLFFNYCYYIASIEYPGGGSVVERGPGNEQSLLAVWWLFGQ